MDYMETPNYDLEEPIKQKVLQWNLEEFNGQSTWKKSTRKK